MVSVRPALSASGRGATRLMPIRRFLFNLPRNDTSTIARSDPQCRKILVAGIRPSWQSLYSVTEPGHPPWSSSASRYDSRSLVARRDLTAGTGAHSCYSKQTIAQFPKLDVAGPIVPERWECRSPPQAITVAQSPPRLSTSKGPRGAPGEGGRPDSGGVTAHSETVPLARNTGFR